MIRKIFIWLFISNLLLTCGNAFANEEYSYIKDYGNVKVRITTGHDYEEIRKGFIIGQLAEKLSIELNYSGPIFLDFMHDYTNCGYLAYFISYDKGKMDNSWEKYPVEWESYSKGKEFLEEEALVIRQYSRQFNAIATLNLLEYAIKNISLVKSLQKQIEISKDCFQYRINSIDTTLITELLHKTNSDLVDSIVKLRIDMPASAYKSGIAYYWQGNKFHFYFSNQNISFISFDNIYIIKHFDDSSAIVFDSTNSFVYMSIHRKPFVSKRHIIRNTNGIYRPFDIESIDVNKISIYFSNESYHPLSNYISSTSIYLKDKDKLMQDVDIEDYKK